MLIQHLFSKPRTHVMSSLFYAVLLEKWWKIRGQIPVKLPITTNGRVHLSFFFFFLFFAVCLVSLHRNMSSTILSVMKVVCQLGFFYFPLELQQGSVGIPHMSHAGAVALRCVCVHTYMYIYVCECECMLFIVEVLQMKASCLPSGITATQEANNQLPLACVASN